MTRIDSPPSTAAPFGALLTAVLSFSLMQTLAVPALPDLQRAFAVMRTVGGAIGAQTAATVVAGTGYTGAFVMSAAAMVVAGLVALTYPREAA